MTPSRRRFLAAALTALPGLGRAADTPARPELGAWTRLDAPKGPGKQDDIAFVDAKRGWYVNGAGRVFRTADGGDTWKRLVERAGTYFRCVAFVDAKFGFAGNIGPGYFPGVTDAVPLYRTRDGGDSWEPVNISGDAVTGLCALQVCRFPYINAGVLGEKTRLYAAGRVGGPAVLATSGDGGETWAATDLSKQCGMVLDVHFFDDRHGVLAAATSSDVRESEALVLRTEDGGTTWARAYQSKRPFELTWKLSFPTRQVGYVTVQSYDPDPKASRRFVAKTTDGGRTWAELPLCDDHAVRTFGVAFADAEVGWVGAVPGGFGTTDGGRTWARVEMGTASNKVRVVPVPGGFDAFAIGVDVRRLRVRRE